MVSASLTLYTPDDLHLTLPPSTGYNLQPVPNILHGAVLGFSARAPDNGSAISISFNSVGYATALARVFQWVRTSVESKTSMTYRVVGNICGGKLRGFRA